MIFNGVTSNKVRIFLFTYLMSTKNRGNIFKKRLYKKSFNYHDGRKFAQIFLGTLQQLYKVK